MEHIHRITQAYSQTPWRKQVRMIGVFLLILVVVATVATAYMNLRARALALGRELQWMQVNLRDSYAISGDDILGSEPTPTPTPTAGQTPEEEEDEPEEIIPIEILERNISLLQTQLATLTSYQVMADRAADMGLVQANPEDIVYLEIAGYAEPQAAVLAPPPQQVVVSAAGADPAFRQSLFDWVGDQIQEVLKLFNGVMP